MSGTTSSSDGHNSDESSEELPVRRTAKALPPLRFKEKHRLLKLRLTPLSEVQANLEQKLGAASTEIKNTPGTSAAPFDNVHNRRVLQEFSINSSNGWKTALDKFRTMRPVRAENGPGSMRKAKGDEEDDVAEVLASLKDDIKALWEDPTVKEMLNRRKVRIEDYPGL